MTPRLRKTLLALVLAIGALVLALEIAARAQARHMAATLAPIATLDYRSAGIGWNGDLRLVEPRIAFRHGPWPGDFSARVAHVSGGGLLWTLARSLPGNEGLPAQGSIELRGLDVSRVPRLAAIGEWLQPPALVLFERQGCDGAPFSAADRQRMLAPLVERIDRIDYRSDASAQRLEIAFAFEQPGITTLRGSAAFRAFSAALWNDERARDALRLAQAELVYDDPGYLARRNAFCAQRSGIPLAHFIERHVEAVDARLAEAGVAPSESMRRMYRDLVGSGGRLSLTTLPDADWQPARFAAQARADLLRRLNITARHNDNPPVMLQLAFSEPEADPALPSSSAPELAAAAPDAIESGPSIARSEPLVGAIEDARRAVTRVSPPAADRIEDRNAARPTAAPTPAAAPARGAPQATDLGPSAAPPPKDSTLALVWKPGVVERLVPREAPAREDEQVAVTALAAYAGRRVRLSTRGGKRVDGELRRIEGGQAIVQVRLARGSAEISVPLANVTEARLVNAGAR